MSVLIKKITSDEVTAVPKLEPISYTLQKSDLYSDATGRSAETGKLLAYPIRQNIYTIRLEYYGNEAEIRQIEKMIDNSLLEVTFMDGNDCVTKTMYPSDREKTAQFLGKNGRGMYSLSFSLIEY